MTYQFARLAGTLLAGAASLALSAAGASAQTQKLDIVIFSPPSLGAFMPPVIKAQKFDTKNGLELVFHERTPDAYTTQFNSGEFKVGGSASLQTIGLADVRGVKVKYLFNLFDYWGTVVTSRDNVKSVKDIEGKQIAAARSTTNYKMFEFFALKQGADISKFQVVNTAPPGLMSYAIADRADAIQIWEPTFTLLKAKKPTVRMLDLGIEKTWKEFSGGGTRIPYLGVAAHAEWADANPEIVKKLFAAYQEAADWIQKNPDAAAALMFPKRSPDDQKQVAGLIRANDRLGISMGGANEMKKEIEAVFRAGMEIKYFPKMPSSASIYDKPVR
jgi:NitT/TauT family transport system substrate-binding protein